MIFSVLRWARSSLAFGIVAYAAGILLASTVVALGSYRVVRTVFAELASRETPPPEARPTTPTRSSGNMQGKAGNPVPAQMSNLPMTGIPRMRQAELAFFGSSSRYWGRSRSSGERDDDDDMMRPRQSGAYRTMCVRLCDGFYFPISFSATPSRFARDAATCENSCGGQARLFVYRNPGADVEDMVDLKGRPYRQLSSAFRYRTEYIAACKCKPDPWEAEARERHRVYALIAASRKGDKQAAAELAALPAHLKPGPAADQVKEPPAPQVTVSTSPEPRTETPGRSEDSSERMGLGARTASEPSRRSRDDGWNRIPAWAKRAFSY